MKTHQKGLLLFIAIILLGFLVGRSILTVFVFGAIMLLGLYVLVESIAPLKWILSRTSRLFDIVLFTFAVLATVKYGFNIAGGLSVCGLGYSLYYAPKLRDELRVRKQAKKNAVPNGKSRYDWR